MHRVGIFQTAVPAYPPAVPETAIGGAVRELFRMLGYDAARAGAPDWNPLGWLIAPGQTVFIKPNMIAHRHAHDQSWEHVITHGSIIGAVVDYVVTALRGRGKIIIGDAPQTDSQWEQIVARMGLKEIQARYRDRPELRLDLLDLRDECWDERDGIYVNRRKLPGDPLGGAVFDLGARSMFAELDGQGKKYYGAYYDVEETNRHHTGGRHEYAVSRSPLAAEVFINIPKLKTHKKCGLTVNLKSLVGINANKNWLPHYAFGAPAEGGDQFDRAQARGRLENALVTRMKKLLRDHNRAAQWLARKGKRLAYGLFGRTDEVVRSGNWHGNDTVWRMCVDLNRILLYGNPDGSWREAARPKKFLSVVDGIIAMEGNGPVAGAPRPAGVLLAGANPVAVDYACAVLMGFDPDRLPLIARCFAPHDLPLIADPPEAIRAFSNNPAWNGAPLAWPRATLLNFKPHFGWAGHIER